MRWSTALALESVALAISWYLWGFLLTWVLSAVVVAATGLVSDAMTASKFQKVNKNQMEPGT